MRYSTTNLRIEEDILKELKLKAVHEGKRVAELIREAIREFLGKTKKISAADIKKDPLFGIIGMCETGHKYDSDNLDTLLYGKK